METFRYVRGTPLKSQMIRPSPKIKVQVASSAKFWLSAGKVNGAVPWRLKESQTNKQLLEVEMKSVFPT